MRTSPREEAAFAAAMDAMNVLCEARYEFFLASGRRYNRIAAEVAFEQLVLAEQAKNSAYAEWDSALLECGLAA